MRSSLGAPAAAKEYSAAKEPKLDRTEEETIEIGLRRRRTVRLEEVVRGQHPVSSTRLPLIPRGCFTSPQTATRRPRDRACRGPRVVPGASFPGTIPRLHP